MSERGHSIETAATSDQVEVRVHGTVVASSTRPVVLTETGAPARYYLPQEDVRLELLRSSPTTSRCPFKGEAVYWAVHTDGGTAEDVVWSYPDPLPGMEAITGRLAFWGEKPGVELAVNGTAQ